MPHFVIEYIPDETYLKLGFFLENVDPPLERWKSFLKKTVSSMHTFQFTVHLYDYEHGNVCWPHMINLPSGTTMSKKTYHAALTL